jgi:hypothetical protein
LVAKSASVDNLRLGDIIAWLKSNWAAVAVALGALGFNVAKPAPVQPDVQFTAAEFSQLIAGFNSACQTEVNKWQKNNHW